MMMSIVDFFDNLYKRVANNDDMFEAVYEYEEKVYNLEDKEFFAWAGCNGIDLNIAKESLSGKTLVLQYWCWDMQEREEL